jgi:hypothetical protein
MMVFFSITSWSTLLLNDHLLFDARFTFTNDFPFADHLVRPTILQPLM